MFVKRQKNYNFSTYISGVTKVLQHGKFCPSVLALVEPPSEIQAIQRYQKIHNGHG